MDSYLIIQVISDRQQGWYPEDGRQILDEAT